MSEPARILVIMGVSGAGKSTLGTLLAERLDVPYLEGDSFHPAANVEKMRQGVPLTDADRWPWLTALGQALAAAATPAGLAIGACSALKHAYREHLSAAAGLPVGFVLLDLPRAVLASRLNQRVGHYMPASLLASQLATLEALQPDERAIRLDGTKAPAQLAEQVLAWLPSWSPAS